MRIGHNLSPTCKSNRRDVIGSVLARINLIKHLWDDLEPNHAPPAILARLVQMLQVEWNAVPQVSLRNLFQSISRQCET